MIYAQELLEHILGITIYDINWCLALYADGTDPVADMAAAEIAGTRTYVVDYFGWVSGNMINTSAFATGTPSADATAGGWFMVNGNVTTCLWSAPFDTPLALVMGESVVNFPQGSISLSVTV